MVSSKPYLLRAIHEWCVDQGFTPYITVVVGPRTRVPREFVHDGQIILNIGTEATNQLLMGNDEISFQARFNGVAFPVVVPVEVVSAIYAKENGQGMAFDVAADAGREDATEQAPAGGAEAAATKGDKPPPAPPTGGRPHLTRVK